MAFKCYYSGVEGKQHYEAVVAAGGVHVLASYLYLEKTDKHLIKRRKQQHPHIRFMIDSGAHTFQSEKEKYSGWSLNDWENYIRRYVKWLRDNRDYIDCAVELDVDWNVGTNVVESWQRRFFIPLLAEGIPIIFVWHKQRGLEGWEEMCSRFPYTGLPGEFSSEPDFNKYMTVARRYTTKVHGFAATKQTDFRDWPWYSGDSTTWKSSERYGTLIHWDESKQQIVFEEDKSKRGRFRKSFEQAGLDADAIIKDTNYREVTRYALYSVRRMEQFYEQKYKDRIFYYELRLPHPSAVSLLSDAEIKNYWRVFRSEKLFPAQAQETNPKKLAVYLKALAAVQYKETALLESQSSWTAFLQTYFPRMLTPKVVDPVLFQKELSAYLAPPNPPPLERCDAEHFVPTNNVPKPRSSEAWDNLDSLPTMEELEKLSL